MGGALQEAMTSSLSSRTTCASRALAAAAVPAARQDAPRRLLADPGLGLQAELAEVVALVDDARDHRPERRLAVGATVRYVDLMGVSRRAARSRGLARRNVSSTPTLPCSPLRGRLDVFLGNLVARRQQIPAAHGEQVGQSRRVVASRAGIVSSARRARGSPGWTGPRAATAHRADRLRVRAQGRRRPPRRRPRRGRTSARPRDGGEPPRRRPRQRREHAVFVNAGMRKGKAKSMRSGAVRSDVIDASSTQRVSA